MNPKVKNVLIICLKNAIVAVLTNGGSSFAFPSMFNFHSWTGVKNDIVLCGTTIASREFIYWGPILWKWASSVLGNGSGQ
jgi:hypothetical protein